MLDFLRQKAQSTVIQVIIVVIILVFVFWGVGSNQGNGVNAVATVNDIPITYTEFQRSYNNRFNQLKDQLGGNIPDGLIQTIDLNNQVLENLIQGTLIRQAAGETGLLVSNEEVRTKIQNMEAFKKAGAFDVDWYKQILASNRMNVTDFEISMKSDLLTSKVMDHLAGFGGVANSELRDRFNYDYRQKKFSYVILEPTEFADKVEITDDALETFFAERKDDYRGEPQLKLKYVLFPFADQEGIEIPEESITTYYGQNTDEFVIPEQRQARHILTMIDENDSEEVITEKRQKSEDLLKQAREGKDFAELAKENSDDKGSAIKGGDLGFFGRGQMVKPFEEGAFGLQEGGMTLVRSDFGFHVIKLEKIKPLSVKSIDEARSSIIAKIKDTEIKNLTFKQANAAYEQIILSGSLEKFAENGGDLKETGYFTRKDLVEPLKSNPELNSAAFALKQGELSSLLEGRASYAILYAQEIKEPEAPELADIKTRVTEDYVKQRSGELAKEAAESILASVRDGLSIEDEAANLALEAIESPMISRANQTESKLPTPLLEVTLGLSEATPYPDAVITSGKTMYVAVFKGEQEASEEKFEEKKEEISNTLMAENKDEILGSWFAFLRNQATIEVDKKF